MPAPATSTTRHWQSRGPLAVLLPIAALYSVLSTLRRYAYGCGALSVQQVSVPVVVVGNITAGGTGKTPLTLWLAQFLRDHGKHPAIISRGYGANRTDPRAVPVGSTASAYGDEPCLLARRAGCPVWVGADRAATARALLEAHPETDVIISDDGLQHYRLARDFEIAVIDGALGLGNGWPLPAGPLREPASRLDSVNAVVVNGDNVADAFPQALTMHLEGGEFRNLRNPGLTVTAAHFRNRRVHAVAGIGNPQRFFAHLQRLGVECVAHPFADHHAFVATDLQFTDADDVVMTEKDAVKCTAFATENHWALVVNAVIDTRLGDMILARLAQGIRHG